MPLPWDAVPHEQAAWAPISAAAELRRAASQPVEHVSWMPLSQMPMPQTQHELDEYTMDSVSVESSESSASSEAQDTVVPISRAPLRLLSGIEALDTYAGRWQSGGAYAPLDEPASHDVLRRGFPIGSALEVVGPPGVGKTTWAMQMAISERLEHMMHTMQLCMDQYGTADDAPTPPSSPRTLMNAMDVDIEPWCAQVVLVDTEGSIAPVRLLSMTRAAITQRHVSMAQRYAHCAGVDADVHHAIERAVLRGIHLVRCTTLGELLAFAGIAASTVLKVPGLPPRTSLLIIDTLSFFTYAHALPINATREQRKAREDAIQCIVRSLTTLRDSQIPEQDRITVVVTMQMSTRRLNDAGSVLQPSLLSKSSTRDDSESVLGRSAQRFFLAYSDVRGHRYVCAAHSECNISPLGHKCCRRHDTRAWLDPVPYFFSNVSIVMVTGPSLIRDTSIIAPNAPLWILCGA